MHEESEHSEEGDAGIRHKVALFELKATQLSADEELERIKTLRKNIAKRKESRTNHHHHHGHHPRRKSRPKVNPETFQAQQLYDSFPANISPLISPSELPAFRVEMGANADTNAHEWNLDIPRDLYADFFYPVRHFNFIGSNESTEEVFFVSVMQNAEDGKFPALKNTKKGFEQFSIDSNALWKYNKKRSQEVYPAEKKCESKSVRKYLQATFPDTKFYEAISPSFPEDLLNIEQKHPQDNGKHLKIALIYSTSTQKDLMHMFSNTSGSSDYDRFLACLGEKIDLSQWNGYRGDMGKSGFTLYTQWREFEIVFHVSTLMDAEGHRRLIGNDVAVIFFVDEGGSLDPTQCIDKIGTVPQVFAVVQPYKAPNHPNTNLFRVATLNRNNVKPYGPDVPNYPLDETLVKEFLLTKIANGYIKALSCPPMSRLFYVPRTAAIQELVEKYSQEHEKEVKRHSRGRSETKRASNHLDNEELLFVRVISGRGLPARDSNNSSDPFCWVQVQDQKFKTFVTRKNLSPFWDQDFTFKLNGIDKVETDLEIIVMDWDRFTFHDFIGSVQIPLFSLSSFLDRETWFKLSPHHNFPIDKNITGEVLLYLTVRSPRS